MHNRLPLVLSSCSLVLVVFATTPLGHAASRALEAVPFAKSSDYAKLAGNSARLNGHKSTLKGLPGTIPVVGSNGKLPESIGAVGPQGPKGDKGDKGVSGANNIVIRITKETLTARTFGGKTLQCGQDERALNGGVADSGGAQTTNLTVMLSRPQPLAEGAASGWAVGYQTGPQPQAASFFIVCAKE